MSPLSLRRIFVGLTTASLLAMPSAASACAACFGASNDAMAKGMNMGIFALLIVVTFVLSGVAAFGFYLVRRAARMAAAEALVGSVPLAEPPPFESFRQEALSQPTTLKTHIHG